MMVMLYTAPRTGSYVMHSRRYALVFEEDLAQHQSVKRFIHILSRVSVFLPTKFPIP